LADRYKAMAHPCRLAILYALALEECCVCDLANILRKPVSTISQHLRMLKAAGLVKSRQDGKLVFYEIESPEILQKIQVPGAVNAQK
jgi:DNA-binding transcriptional ArsR family regulator